MWVVTVLQNRGEERRGGGCLGQEQIWACAKPQARPQEQHDGHPNKIPVHSCPPGSSQVGTIKKDEYRVEKNVSFSNGKE